MNTTTQPHKVTAKRDGTGMDARIGDTINTIGGAGTISINGCRHYSRITALRPGRHELGAHYTDATLEDGSERRLWQGFQYLFLTTEPE